MDNRDLLEAQLMSKSTGIAAVLTLFFGGFGLLYLSIINGLIGAVIECVLFIAVFLTGGFGLILYVPWRIVCVIVGISMAGAHNRRLLRKIGAASAARAPGPAPQVPPGSGA